MEATTTTSTTTSTKIMNQGPINIQKYIKQKKFDDIKYELQQAPYNLDVKEDDTVYMLNFTNNSDLNEQICREANGVIFEKQTNKLLHWSFPKTYNGLLLDGEIHGAPENETDYLQSFNLENAKYEVYTEGTLIKVFYNDGWKVATSHTLDASMCFWNSDKSFKEMFYEAMEHCELNINDLDQKYCYSFILQHPENKLNMTISEPYTKEIGRFSEDEPCYINEENLYTLPEKNLDYFLSDDNTNEDVIIYLDNVRVKILSRSTLTNKNSMEIEKEATKQKIQDFITGSKNVYPDNYLPVIEKIANIIEDEAILVYTQYFLKNIKKQKINILQRHSKLIYDLHGAYLNYKIPITVDYVKDFLRYQPVFLNKITKCL